MSAPEVVGSGKATFVSSAIVGQDVVVRMEMVGSVIVLCGCGLTRVSEYEVTRSERLSMEMIQFGESSKDEASKCILLVLSEDWECCAILRAVERKMRNGVNHRKSW